MPNNYNNSNNSHNILNKATSILSNNGYTIIQIFKQTKKDIVALVTHKDKKYNTITKYVAKLSTNIPPILTEIQAYNYFSTNSDFANTPFFIKLINVLPNNNNDNSDICGFIMEYTKNATPLIEIESNNAKNNNITKLWWKSLLMQLIVCVNLLEKHHILHNDFWDANIMIQKYPKNRKIIVDVNDNIITIPNAGFIIKVIDFQYTHQYDKNNNIVSPMVQSTKKSDKAEKLLLGWTSKWHTGGDLNQIFGILHEYKSAPAKFKNYVAKHVHKHTSDFPYATTKTNKWFDSEKMLDLCINDKLV